MTDQNQIPTNLRMLLILEAIADAGGPVTPTEINDTLGLPKATIHRLFATLEAEGFIERELSGRSYTPSRRLRRLATHVLSSTQMRSARIAVLRSLAEQIGETCNIAVPEIDAMVYLDRVETKWPLRIQLPVGTAVPFHCTAGGKLYLSTLPPKQLERYLKVANLEPQTPSTITNPQDLLGEIARIKHNGYAQDNEEFMPGMIALAVPVNDDRGKLLSTLAFHAPTMRLNLQQAGDHLPSLKAAALELSELLCA